MKVASEEEVRKALHEGKPLEELLSGPPPEPEPMPGLEGMPGFELPGLEGMPGGADVEDPDADPEPPAES